MAGCVEKPLASPSLLNVGTRDYGTGYLAIYLVERIDWSLKVMCCSMKGRATRCCRRCNKELQCTALWRNIELQCTVMQEAQYRITVHSDARGKI